MKEFIFNLLSESPKLSSTRFMALVSLFAGIIIAFIGLSKHPDKLPDVTLLSGMFVGVAFTGKVTSKFVEVSGNNKKEVGASNAAEN